MREPESKSLCVAEGTPMLFGASHLTVEVCESLPGVSVEKVSSGIGNVETFGILRLRRPQKAAVYFAQDDDCVES